MVRLLFVALLAGWLAFPFLQVGVLAQDAIPFIAAARVDGHAAGSLYGPAEKEGTDAIRVASCPLKPEGSDCEAVAFPFLGPPQIVPVMKVVNALGDQGSLLAMRLLAAGGMVAGMAVLWARFAREGAQAQFALLVTAALLTPYAYIESAFGQTASLMFLSACLGLSRTGKTRGAVAAALSFVGASLFKLFPLPLLLLAAARRRWQFVAWSVGLLAALTVITFAVVPTFQYGEFLSTSQSLTASRVGSPWNVSVDSLVFFFDSAWRGKGAAFYGFVLVRLAVLGGLFWWKLRKAGEDLQWAWCWVALLALHPQIWWHYFIVVVPAVLHAVASRRERNWWVVAAGAAVILPMAIVTDETTLKFYGVLVAVGSTIALAFYANGSRSPEAVEAATVS